jgi:cyclopropane-fatty-acyl-phospholipid synthase
MKNAFKDLVLRVKSAEPNASLIIEFWDGDILTVGKQPIATLRLKSEACVRKILAEGFAGFGEAYMQGILEVEGDLQELLRLGMVAGIAQMRPSGRERLWFFIAHLKSRNTLKGACKNISHHYDLGEDFYSLYLDSYLTYSCAYFKTPDDSLEQAQLNKYDHIARKLMLRSGEKLLDVGCGWGGMLIHAAQRYGIKGLGNTLSRQQYEYANRKIKELGLQGQIKVVLDDYRHLTGKFDKLVSIGMFEHVGKEFIHDFMRKAFELLKKGGLGLLHTIGKETESPGDLWTMRYIFPGGYLPNLPEVAFHMGEAGLSILDVENLRLHYARTLDLWARNFEKNIEKVREMFEETFVRMWRLYLHASPAGFRYAEARIYQILFSNGLNNQLPMTREHVYTAANP